MVKIAVALFALVVTAACAVQPSTALAQSPQSQLKHYRLTFVLSYPQGDSPSQTFILDVPVARDHAGMAGSTTTSSLIGRPESAIQENLECTDVQESNTGLSAKVAFSMESTAQPLPGSTGPRHSNLTFNRQIDVELNKPTRITEEMHATPLRKGDEVYANALPPAPQITVTATVL